MVYLKEFRVEQCPLFLQHKCTQHRPFTCFHWHFMNQRRRRPVRKRDGSFNYSADHYCTKFDETTGLCPEGDECPFLHRTAGDTERRYHLRYYKTCMCALENPEADPSSVSNGPNVLDKERNLMNEDPKWQDTSYVLANYKTEPCKRPPRLCRQGYACPQYHNSRDKRRSPRKFKYRSTPCPNVKHSDEWGEPGNCDSGDMCPYCHTRTEQQFHPEIYKSTKCNDVQTAGYCPRGVFCAFAHVERLLGSSAPVNIPGSSLNDRSTLGNFSPSTSSPLQQLQSGFLPTSRFSHQDSLDSVQRLCEELASSRSKLASWDERITQARTACEAWQREAEETSKKANIAEQQRDEALSQAKALQKEVDLLQGSPYLHGLRRRSELKTLSLSILKSLELQLRNDLEEIEKVIYLQTATKCMVCEVGNRSVTLAPCNHFVLCNKCAPDTKECPYCQVPVLATSGMQPL
uniref:RING finger protein unkempt n=1 Tax=Timema douglasi TaxID=61478 RepID=A0A7R8VJK0_TIMDO|nr:unnamed protein product [Timema douglasi]